MAVFSPFLSQNATLSPASGVVRRAQRFLEMSKTIHTGISAKCNNELRSSGFAREGRA
jgi:hypothetical protein